MALKCMMSRTDIASGKVIVAEASFRSRPQIKLGDNMGEIYDAMVPEVLRNIDTFQQTCSNWRFESIVLLEIHTVKYEPLKPRAYINLPKTIKNKQACINPQNMKDNECFKWCITRALNPVKKPTKNNQKIKRTVKEF